MLGWCFRLVNLHGSCTLKGKQQSPAQTQVLLCFTTGHISLPQGHVTDCHQPKAQSKSLHPRRRSVLEDLSKFGLLISEALLLKGLCFSPAEVACVPDFLVVSLPTCSLEMYPSHHKQQSRKAQTQTNHNNQHVIIHSQQKRRAERRTSKPNYKLANVNNKQQTQQPPTTMASGTAKHQQQQQQ